MLKLRLIPLFCRTNGITLVFSFAGTGFIINRYGLTTCLTLFPVTVGLVIVMAMQSSINSINVLFYAMVVIKGLSYALNVPCKEMLYIPTSQDVKYKAKSWIDMFGGRSGVRVRAPGFMQQVRIAMLVHVEAEYHHCGSVGRCQGQVICVHSRLHFKRN